MFVNLFQALRRRAVPVSLDEWLLLQSALAADLPSCSLTRFYYLARSILVKSENHYDRYDQAFLECFGRIESTDELIRQAEAAMRTPQPLELTEEEKRLIERLGIREVDDRFLEQLRARKFRQHEGGNVAIGVRGRSTHGAMGFNPAGVRIGQGGGRAGGAVRIAERRHFENYRDDLLLDTRSMKLALQYLRQVVREGPKDTLNVDRTIDATCRNAGELELVWERPRKKKIRLLLLMDAGGTMDPHIEIVSLLFSAAKDIVRDLKHYYFHNCVYQELYTDIAQRKTVATRSVLERTNRDYKVILVGDAYMAPTELLAPNGAIDYWYRNDRPGLEWLTEIRKRFRKAIWLNPEPKRWWESVPTTVEIKKLFPMFELTLSGLRAASRALVR